MFRERFLSSSQVDTWLGRPIVLIPSRPVPAVAVSAYSSAVIADTPISYWKFDESSGAYLPTYGANTASVIGSPTRPTPGAAGSGRAVGFPSTSDYVQLGAVGSLPGTSYRSSFSVECWFKVSTLPVVSSSPHTYLLIGTDNSNMSFGSMSWYAGLYRTTVTGGIGKVYFTASASGASKGVETPTLYDNDVWHHVVGTYDGAAVRLYVDGGLIGSIAMSGPVNEGSYDPRMGVLPLEPMNFPGLIDEVAIYPSVLSAARVLAHYQAAS